MVFDTIKSAHPPLPFDTLVTGMTLPALVERTKRISGKGGGRVKKEKIDSELHLVERTRQLSQPEIGGGKPHDWKLAILSKNISFVLCDNYFH